MPALSQRASARSEELIELVFSGPFGGIQSELPPDRIEQFGFLDVSNVLFRKGAATVRFGWNALPLMPNPQENIVGIADFFDLNANRHQMLITPTRLLEWSQGPQTWVAITGPGLTGPSAQIFGWAVSNYKFLFSQGTDKVQSYDGVSGTYAPVSANAVPAYHAMELYSYLVVANTVEASVHFPQRVRWTSPNNVTDWTGLNAGVADITSDLGPINGCAKIFQNGYLIHWFGITQMLFTGNGLAPWNFVPIASNNHGCFYPNTIAHQGGEFIVYVGIDNVYMFDGTNCSPIGDQPIDGRRRLGARRRILADLATANNNAPFGYITTTIGGNDFNAYWLVIPGAVTWMYNFDEGNWTRCAFSKVISTVGRFTRMNSTRIIDLVGPISSQTWSPTTLTGFNFQDGFLLGFADGTPGYVDYTNYSELPWYIKSGQCVFGDLRHSKTIKKFRVVIQDFGQVTFSIAISGYNYPNPAAGLDTNNQPITTNANTTNQTQVVTMGNGSGQAVSRVVEFNLPGNYINWTISGAAGQPASFLEFTPIYDTGGEQRGG